MAFDVYLSSTLDDLLEERAAVKEVLQGLSLGVKESYGAGEKEPETSSSATRLCAAVASS